MTDAVPVYVQSKGNAFFRYGTQVTGENGWDTNKTVAFYAYSTRQEGTVPFYRHRASTTDRFQIDTIPGSHDGWSAGEDPFYAYPATDPRKGTIPIYNHTNTDKTRYQYSAQMAGSGAGWQTGTLEFFALPVLEGYRVRDKVAEIAGKDQSGNDVKLSKFIKGKDWALVDICAQWCGPCNFAAQKTRGFIDSINATKGSPFKLKPFTVMVDGRDYGPSTQIAAQQWAARYLFDQNEPVLHCDGDPKSDLRSLASKFTLANNIPEAAYPTYVLVDSDGVVRYFQQGFDLDELQRQLGALAGINFTGGPWIGIS